MCNLYSQTRAQDAVRTLFKVQHESDLTGNLPSKPAIFPAHNAPIVRLNDQGERSLVMMFMLVGNVAPRLDMMQIAYPFAMKLLADHSARKIRESMAPPATQAAG